MRRWDRSMSVQRDSASDAVARQRRETQLSKRGFSIPVNSHSEQKLRTRTNAHYLSFRCRTSSIASLLNRLSYSVGLARKNT
jgi:hypothetical protein